MQKIPEWLKEASKLYGPYMAQGPKGPYLREDAPPEAVEAYKKLREWAWDLGEMQ